MTPISLQGQVAKLYSSGACPIHPSRQGQDYGLQESDPAAAATKLSSTRQSVISGAGINHPTPLFPPLSRPYSPNDAVIASIVELGKALVEKEFCNAPRHD